MKQLAILYDVSYHHGESKRGFAPLFFPLSLEEEGDKVGEVDKNLKRAL